MEEWEYNRMKKLEQERNIDETEIEVLKNNNKKLKQEKKELLTALKTVNEIRDKLRVEKNELREMFMRIIEHAQWKKYIDSNDNHKNIYYDIKQLLNKIKE